MKKIYGDKIFYTQTKRSNDFWGEIHLQENKNKFELLEGICIDILLMSKVNYLIHGLSNISNFVLCLNPKLKHSNVYSNAISVL